MRGRTRAALQGRAADRRGRGGPGAHEAVGDGEAVLHRRRDGGHNGRGAGARRVRLHPGVPRRADDARREDHPDLRGHEPDPAARDRPRDAEGEPRVPARGGRVDVAAPADAQRDRAVDVLKRAYAEGRLELEARAARALATRSPWELRLQLRGLVADDVQRRVRRGARVAGAVAMWAFLSFFLAVTFVVALIATHASPWTLGFPLVWLLVTALALREVRRR